MFLLIIGVLLIIGGGVLLITRRKSLNLAMDIKYHETSRVVDVVDTYKQIKDELGVGNYSGNIVELSGNGHSDSPLIAEFSQRPALYCETTVTREYEVTEQKQTSDGKYQTVTERKSEQVSKNSQHIPFYLDDGSGDKVLVDMEGAKKHLVQSYDQFRQEAPAGYNTYSGLGSKTLGYRYKEKIIPANIRLYVLGEVSDRRGELSVIKPQEKGKPFIVSTKSEEDLTKSAEGSAMTQLVIAIILALGGLGCIIAYFL